MNVSTYDAVILVKIELVNDTKIKAERARDLSCMFVLRVKCSEGREKVKVVVYYTVLFSVSVILYFTLYF